MTQASRGKAASADSYDLARGNPASHKPDQKLCRLDRCAVVLATFGARGWSQGWHAEDRQGPATKRISHSQ
jgi:hypothetical protein